MELCNNIIINNWEITIISDSDLSNFFSAMYDNLLDFMTYSLYSVLTLSSWNLINELQLIYGNYISEGNDIARQLAYDIATEEFDQMVFHLDFDLIPAVLDQIQHAWEMFVQVFLGNFNIHYHRGLLDLDFDPTPYSVDILPFLNTIHDLRNSLIELDLQIISIQEFVNDISVNYPPNEFVEVIFRTPIIPIENHLYLFLNTIVMHFNFSFQYNMFTTNFIDFRGDYFFMLNDFSPDHHTYRRYAWFFERYWLWLFRNYDQFR